MGCGMSSTVDPEDATLTTRCKVVSSVTNPNKPPTHPCDIDESEKSSSFSSRGSKIHNHPHNNNNSNGGGEDKEDHDQILFLPSSPSFKDYCIGTHSRDTSCDTESAFSTKNGGDEDSSANGDNSNNSNKPPEENKQDTTKKERRRLGLRHAMHRLNNGKPRGKRHLLNFGCYTSHASYDDHAFNKASGKMA